MSKVARPSFASDFRRFFVRGLATLLPTVLTIVLLVKCFEFVQQNISVHITEGVIRLVVMISDDYPKLDRQERTEYATLTKPGLNDDEIAKYLGDIEGDTKIDREMRLWELRGLWNSGVRSLVGFALAILVVYIVGRLLASYLGRKLWELFENTVRQIPVLKRVYPYVKQVTDFLFGENKIKFSRVVALQYPRPGVWSIGLVTGAGFRFLADKQKEEFLTIFIPSSPTPVTGYTISVNKNEVLDLPISVEEALRFTVSGGVIVPAHQELPRQLTAQQAEPNGDDKT